MQITSMSTNNHLNYKFSNNTSFKSLKVQEKALKNLGYTTQKALINDYPLLKKLSKNRDIIIKNGSRLVYNYTPAKLCGFSGVLVLCASAAAMISGFINPAIGLIGILAGGAAIGMANPKRETVDFTEIEVNKTNSDGSTSKKTIRHEKEDSFNESVEILNYLINNEAGSINNEELDKIIYMRNWRDSSRKLDEELYEETGIFY